MRATGVITRLLLATGMLFIASCAPSLQEIGREQGCEVAEEHLQAYIVREIRNERFERNLPYRLAMLPFSVTFGYIFNYIGQLNFVLPLLSPTGYSLEGTEFGALLLENVLTYSPLRGSRLDKLDNSVIARAQFEVGMCYYETENYAQASAFFEDLLDGTYAQYVGVEYLFFLLGDCYYMLSLYERSIENYQCFLHYCSADDDRIPLVEQRIKTIEAIYKKGLWGIENPE